MGAKTGIEWTDATWNPIRGCSRVSEGCRNCYAESVAYRFGGEGQPYEGLVQIGADGERKPQWNGQVRLVEEHLLDPLKWAKPRRIFANSMSDLFHEGAQEEWIDKIFAVMALCPQHDFQVLTKRPARMLEYLSPENRRYTARRVFDAAELMNPRDGYRFDVDCYWPLFNIWLGVSCENQAAADARIPLLLQTPAAVRFLSAEPLLGEINLHPHLCVNGDPARLEQRFGAPCVKRQPSLDWVICGGESGSGARSMRAEWARSLRDQCASAGVPFFFKQWGEWLGEMQDGAESHEDGGVINASDDPVRVGKKKAGALLDGREWREFPQ